MKNQYQNQSIRSRIRIIAMFVCIILFLSIRNIPVDAFSLASHSDGRQTGTPQLPKSLSIQKSSSSEPLSTQKSSTTVNPQKLDSATLDKYQSLLRKPIHTKEQAEHLLQFIIMAEGLKAKQISFLFQDPSGNYYFSVSYENFPDNIRIVTNDGSVIEDYDH
ncbi:hypothetical protein LSG31_05275 [Fodinisporobacter ferrooxydans]|uniref:PepSY domain-containing protein n=1 Tax=Fodinisporobacter ferrooxydans TaxID=2901836 RepID=A0ABY4CME1_9BACL|nr:hypothetical protein LSG31_05275 [Alicyclobacillaceae bacterium MYW30-H2]